MPRKKGNQAKRFLPTIGIVIVLALTLLSGVIQGTMSDRWGPPEEMLAAAGKLEDIPSEFGSWSAKSSSELSDSVVDMLECAGYILREYVNEETGESVQVGLLLGPSGSISVHTPDICFSSRDYEIHQKRQRVTVQTNGTDHEFWAMTFQSKDLDAEMLRVYYAWTPDQEWSAPEEPRFTFASRPFLHKLQLASPLPPGANLEASDPCRNFLEDFLPVAKGYLAETAD